MEMERARVEIPTSKPLFQEGLSSVPVGSLTDNTRYTLSAVILRRASSLVHLYAKHVLAIVDK